MKPYKTAEELKSAFENDSKFHKITNQYQWSHRGLIEAFSILLPEKYNLELFELIDFFFDKNINKQQQQFHNHNTYEWFVTRLSDSLKWREINSIDNDKITNWINENTKYIRDNETIYNKLVEKGLDLKQLNEYDKRDLVELHLQQFIKEKEEQL